MRVIFILKKELTDIVRDRRTVIISVIVPLLLFPMVFFTMRGMTGSGDTAESFRISTRVEGQLREIIMNDPKVSLTEVDDITQGIREGTIDAALSRRQDTKAGVRLLYDNMDRRSIEAASHVTVLLQSLNSPAGQIYIEMKPMYPVKKAAAWLFLSTIVPIFLFIFCCSCPLPIAADISAGEKERKSLEPLLSTGTSRTIIILGKLQAVTIAGFISVSAFCTGLLISYILSPSVFTESSMNISVSVWSVSIILILALILTMIFSAIEIAAGVFARSSREAQLMGMPILVICMTAVYLAGAVSLKTMPSYYPHLPLVNIALALRTCAMDIPRMDIVLPAIVWGMVYGGVVSFLAIFMFHREWAIFRT